MNNQEMVTTYIELIKGNKYFEPDVLEKVISKYKVKVCIELVNGLSNYLDYVNSVSENDDIFHQKMNRKYGYTEQYYNQQDKEWEGVTGSLWETNYDEMLELRNSHNKYWEDKWQYIQDIANGKAK